MKKESSMQKLFAYAGNYKYLIIASWILSAVSALIALLPFYDISVSYTHLTLPTKLEV